MSIPKVTNRTPLLSGSAALDSAQAQAPKRYSDKDKCEVAHALYDHNVKVGESFVFTYRFMDEAGSDATEAEFAKSITQWVKSLEILVISRSLLSGTSQRRVGLLEYIQNPKNKVEKQLVAEICLLADIDVTATASKVADKAKAYLSADEKNLLLRILLTTVEFKSF